LHQEPGPRINNKLGGPHQGASHRKRRPFL